MKAIKVCAPDPEAELEEKQEMLEHAAETIYTYQGYIKRAREMFQILADAGLDSEDVKEWMKDTEEGYGW
jgi:DNA-binding phage protein